MNQSALIRQCSWCERVEAAPGNWSAARYLPLASHGICPQCRSRVEEEYRNRPAGVMTASPRDYNRNPRTPVPLPAAGY